jgi:hypothetical protein
MAFGLGGGCIGLMQKPSERRVFVFGARSDAGAEP